MHSVALLVCGLAFLAWGASAEHPEPQVFHNLTNDAFLTKVQERRGYTPGPGPGPGNFTQLGACVREGNSSAPIQSAVEDLAAKCTQLLNDGSDWRPLSGMCLGQEGGRAKVEVTCAPVSPTTKGILPVVKTFQCDAEEPCVTVRGPDSADTVAKFAPSPGDRGRLVKVETVERVGTAIQYIGSWYSGNAEEAFNLFAQVLGPSKRSGVREAKSRARARAKNLVTLDRNSCRRAAAAGLQTTFRGPEPPSSLPLTTYSSSRAQVQLELELIAKTSQTPARPLHQTPTMSVALDVKIPDFTHTSTDDIYRLTDTLRATFRSNKTKDLKWRTLQLRKLYWAIKDFTPQLCDALRKDLRKCKHESLLSEVEWAANDCLYMIKNLEKFAKDESCEDVPLTYAALKPRIRKEPLGMALVIGAFNFPVQLTLLPIIGAIAAGCTAVLKPSESAPTVAMVLAKIFEAALDPKAYTVVNGAVKETQALLDVKWDKIMYTGSTAVGKIIAKKAAETLTPVTLELGGLNPAFVTKNANVKLAARRLMWSKCLNAGQVCISQNYILADRAIVEPLVQGLNETLRDFFPSGAKNSPDFARIVNQRSFQRIKKMLDETSGKIVMGGGLDEDQLYIEPTAVLVDSMLDSVMKEESFGPVFAIMPYDTLDDAINIANQVYRTPLALFSFGNDKENERILNEVTSGGATLNDAFFHASIATVPFGGVGESGTGSYRGRASFDMFTHRRSVAQTPTWIEKFIRVRYMPYSPKELARLQGMTAHKPDFDRNGVQVRGVGYWLGFVLGLGAKGAKGIIRTVVG
ncbi:Beta-apo-4'-carotenal oxygenase [Colletotrichum trifolii]|uniref:Beta-apo-4'-carotenal oxygenase n=1 Tax=Colletotrichum trifolii TaxID=5466 RepID=A0A4R8RE78_COLTR|nr:Beta-apo-4'-carotenal oxygenase [Colletotrichum trifolii]